ncbi:MAG: hypothetical protein H6811_11395 [Phycisphaeraceae bacterium]|nr:hypothetical protein [Phycisphaeraceae bacterium]
MNRIRCAVVVCASSLALCGCMKKDERLVSDLRQLGNRAYAQGDYPLALKRYTEIRVVQPQNWKNRLDIARTLTAMDDDVGASEELMVAHRLNPSDGETMDRLADALYAAGRPKELFTTLRAEAASGGTAEDYLRLGRISARAGALEDATDAYNQAYRLSDGQDPAPILGLADVYRRAGDTERELSYLRMALSFEPIPAEAPARIRELGHVPGPSFALQPDVEGP